MEIKFLGHASFKISSQGKSIVLDPFKDGSVPGYRDIREKADAVYCSHEHGDHSARECVEIIGEAPFEVEIIDTYHDEVKGAKRGPNKIHIFNIENKKVVHLGDLGCDLEEEQIAKLKNANIVMCPIGGFFTIDAKSAKKIMDQLTPDMIIPMHYHTDTLGYDVIGGLEPFVSQFEQVTYLDSDKIKVEDTKNKGVVVFQY